MANMLESLLQSPSSYGFSATPQNQLPSTHFGSYVDDTNYNPYLQGNREGKMFRLFPDNQLDPFGNTNYGPFLQDKRQNLVPRMQEGIGGDSVPFSGGESSYQGTSSGLGSERTPLVDALARRRQGARQLGFGFSGYGKRNLAEGLAQRQYEADVQSLNDSSNQYSSISQSGSQSQRYQNIMDALEEELARG